MSNHISQYSDKEEGRQLLSRARHFSLFRAPSCGGASKQDGGLQRKAEAGRGMAVAMAVGYSTTNSGARVKETAKKTLAEVSTQT